MWPNVALQAKECPPLIYRETLPNNRNFLIISNKCRYLIAANGEQDVLFGDLEACREHGFQIGLISVLPKAGHLTSAGHLYAQHHVSTSQPREGKLRNLENTRHAERPQDKFQVCSPLSE